LNKLIKAILFDADNTLYDTQKAAKIADNQIVEELAQKTDKYNTKELYAEWKKIVYSIRHSLDPGMHERRYSYGEMIKKLGLDEETEEVLNRFGSVFLSHLKLMPGLPNALKTDLKKYKKAILSESEKDFMLIKLKKLKLSKYFDLIIGNEDVGAKLKPNPEYYIIAFKELKLRPEECIMIGDHYEKDLEIAQKRFGMKVIFFGKQEKRANLCIESFEKIGEIIKKIV